MKMISSRELSAKHATIWTDLPSEGALVITKRGQPVGILTPTCATTLLGDMQEITFARARHAVTGLRQNAAVDETNKMSMEDIDAEICAVRAKERSL